VLVFLGYTNKIWNSHTVIDHRESTGLTAHACACALVCSEHLSVHISTTTMLVPVQGL
jgi:hypothetical protein